MLDLVLWALTKADMRAFAVKRGLFVSDGQGGHVARDGFEWSWWAGSGKMLQAHPEYDEEGNLLKGPVHMPGVVALARIHASFFDGDKIEPASDDPEKGEQWARSKLVRFIRENGRIGQAGGIPYAEIDGVRVLRPADVQAKLAEWGAPGHEWLGGNAH